MLRNKGEYCPLVRESVRNKGESNYYFFLVFTCQIVDATKITQKNQPKVPQPLGKSTATGRIETILHVIGFLLAYSILAAWFIFFISDIF